MMRTHDMDPDVVRWGLHLLDVCTFSHGGSPGVITRYDPDLCQVEYVREGFCQHSYVENDEAVARAYQEELSRLDCMDASGMLNFENEQVQASVNAQDWLSSSNGSCNFDHQRVCDESCQNSADESNDMKGVENCGPSERENDVHEVGVFGSSSGSGDDDLWHSLEISDESCLDGEVGKRLNQMVPIPFRALSDQLYRSSNHHKFVREQIVQQLKSYPDVYAGYVPMDYSDYLKKMSKSGEWGDHVTLQAASDWYGVKIFVITSFKDTCYIEILPQIQKSGRVIFLSFWAEVHYNSIYPEGEMPSSYDYAKKKKRWWNFG